MSKREGRIYCAFRDEKTKNFEETGGTEVDEKFCSRREAKYNRYKPDEFACDEKPAEAV